MTTLKELYDSHRQSPWIDNLQRSQLRDGTLQDFIAVGIRGLTSNPTIFQKAIQNGVEYDDQFASLVNNGASVEEAYWAMVIQDIQDACDVFRPLHQSSDGCDGFVSVEVDPRLARRTDETITQGRELAARVGRPNVMIKVPATVEGLRAITELTADGISVNVTLIFSVKRYAAVIDAYLAGLERRVAASLPIRDVNSVASFFISRVDSLVDPLLSPRNEGHELLGRTAINQAKAAFDHFEQVISGARWKSLAAAGARPQRPLWASTSTKNAAYPDTLYVDELIGPETVNTLPENTMSAFIDHGRVARTIDSDLDRALAELQQLSVEGISLDEVERQLESEGVRSFETSFEDLLKTLEAKQTSMG